MTTNGIPQEVRGLGDHVLKVSKGELAVSVKVSLLNGFVTHKRDLIGRQLPFGQLIQGLLQVLLTDEVVPVEVWNTIGVRSACGPEETGSPVTAVCRSKGVSP